MDNLKIINENLNEKEQLAVETIDGNIRVISGAGTGKTLIITSRYIFLVNVLGIANANILCITFTNNAASEMKKRIDEKVKDKDVGYICTFHALAVKMLREDIHCVNISQNFTVLDEEDRSLIFKKIYKKLGITNKNCHYADIKEYISVVKSKQELITRSHLPVNYIECLAQDSDKKIFEDVTDIKQKFFNEYIIEQRNNSLLDFDDLINICLYILYKFDEKRLKWQKRFQYIMCDEFNDINNKEYQMLKILSDYHKNLMIVRRPRPNHLWLERLRYKLYY